MTLCDKDHQEVCFDGMECPVCLEFLENKQDKKTIERLEQEVSDLKSDNDELFSRLYEIEGDKS
jgi:transcription initiation factor IIE alpha subunit